MGQEQRSAATRGAPDALRPYDWPANDAGLVWSAAFVQHDGERGLRSEALQAVQEGEPLDAPIPEAPGPLSAAAIAALAQPYDWDVQRVVCVILRESGGDPTAVSATDDHGLGQLHRGPPYDPDVTGWVGWRAYFERIGWGWWPYDPEWNVAAMYHIYERAGRTFGPWTTAAAGSGC